VRLLDLFRRTGARAATLPPGMRAYAIGDVHGRLDLLTELFARIAADTAARGPADTHLVLLGDLIDRGPQSAGVVELLRAGAPAWAGTMHVVMGNHEEMLLRMLDEPTEEGLATFLRYGGYQTLESYGAPERMLELPELYRPEELFAFVPAAHRDWLRGLADRVALGDYLFVHAGVRPGVALDVQDPVDLRWIRAPFLDSRADHGATVVHGHSIAPAAELRPNRIGIDTGAFASGVLTAVGLEGEARWLLATGHT